jgi:CheY-like chemotaxis protein
MDGQIIVESVAGAGTTFRVLLPPAQDGAAAGDDARDSRAEAESMRVLVIDDERAIGTSLAILLKGEHEVASVTRAADAIARLEAGESFDVILCDLMMPEMSGMGFYRVLLERWPELAPRVVFLTGGAFTAASREFLERVPNARLEKPFEARRLYEAMRAVRAAGRR